MNSIIEAREYTLKYLEPVVRSHGFTVKLSASKQARIERKIESGMDILGFDMLNYAPSFQIRYGFNKVNTKINDTLIRLQEKVKLRVPEDKKSWFIFFSYNTINKPGDTVYLPMMETEIDVQQAVGIVSQFMEETAIPLLDKFNNLSEIDTIINGVEPWETDWRKPFSLGSNFPLKRLIIAKFAGGDNYQRILNYLTDWFTSRFDDKYGSDYKATMAAIEELDKLLHSN